MIHVMLFGQLADLAGTGSLEVDDVADTAALQQQLHRRIPALAGATYRIAVNKTVVTQNTHLTGDVTVALLPPFSGG
jgi:molybdopterin converting factor small subunit